MVLGEGLGGEEVEGAGLRVFKDGVEDGEIVAEGLAGGSGGDDHDVLACVDGVHGLALVGE